VSERVDSLEGKEEVILMALAQRKITPELSPRLSRGELKKLCCSI